MVTDNMQIVNKKEKNVTLITFLQDCGPKNMPLK